MECKSCKKETSEGTSFPCPTCGKTIDRCSKCKKLSIKYQCNHCDYIGP